MKNSNENLIGNAPKRSILLFWAVCKFCHFLKICHFCFYPDLPQKTWEEPCSNCTN